MSPVMSLRTWGCGRPTFPTCVSRGATAATPARPPSPLSAARPPGARRRAPGAVLDRPRIARVPVVGIVAQRTHGQLGHVELAEADRAGGEEPGPRGAVMLGDEVLRGPGAARGRQATDEAEILERERHAVERPPPLSPPRVVLEAAGRGQGALAGHRDG